MQQTEEYGHKEQRCDGGEQQAADHGAAQRSVLLAAFAHAQRHRHHADDHGQRGHQHRPEAGEAGLQRGFGGGSVPSAICSLAKLTTRMLLAVATPMHMIEPVRAGTLSVVRGDEQDPDDAGQRRRQRRDDDERIEPGLEVHHDQQVDQQDGEDQARQQADNRTSAWSGSGRAR